MQVAMSKAQRSSVKHASLKVSSGQLREGDLAFLPRDAEACSGVLRQPPQKVKGHPVLVIQVFDCGPGKELLSRVWILVVSIQWNPNQARTPGLADKKLPDLGYL